MTLLSRRNAVLSLREPQMCHQRLEKCLHDQHVLAEHHGMFKLLYGVEASEDTPLYNQ
jgi:hypothetical protein